MTKPTARQVACTALEMCMSPDVGGHTKHCDRLTAAIIADRDTGGREVVELESRRHGYLTWVDDKGNVEPAARTFRAMWNGLRTKIEEDRASLALVEAQHRDEVLKGLELRRQVAILTAEVTELAKQNHGLVERNVKGTSVMLERVRTERDTAEVTVATLTALLSRWQHYPDGFTESDDASLRAETKAALTGAAVPQTKEGTRG